MTQQKQEPVAKPMTAHRAVYFMERFKKEEKLLGPNEQAAVDFVIAMLEQAQKQEPLAIDDAGIYEFWARNKEQEPVAYGMPDTQFGRNHRMMMVRLDKGQDGCTVPLYTSPPHQPLTDELFTLLKRYRTETPLGHQPHMIAHLADEALAKYEAAHGIKGEA